MTAAIGNGEVLVDDVIGNQFGFRGDFALPTRLGAVFRVRGKRVVNGVLAVSCVHRVETNTGAIVRGRQESLSLFRTAVQCDSVFVEVAHKNDVSYSYIFSLLYTAAGGHSVKANERFPAGTGWSLDCC